MITSQVAATQMALLLLLGTTACDKVESGTKGADRASAAHSEQAEASQIAADQCQTGEVQLVTDLASKSGTLEFLAPIADIDAYNQKVHRLSVGSCLPVDQLQNLVSDSGPTSGAPIELLVAYDPKGTPQNHRARFDFEADPGTPDVKPPMPPTDMKFGEAIWNPGMTRLAVAWYKPDNEWFEQFACSGRFIKAALPVESDGAARLRCFREPAAGSPEICSEPRPIGAEIEPSQVWMNRHSKQTICEHGGYCYPRHAVELHPACDVASLLQRDE